MRFALSVLPFLAAFACTTQPSAVPVEQALPDASARFVDPGDFQDPDCMLAFVDEVRALEDMYRDIYRDGRRLYLDLYQDAVARGASAQELAEIRREAEMARDMLLDALQNDLSSLEQDVCDVDPCEDPDDPQCCPFVGDDGQCYQDYCDAYPEDPNCWDPCQGLDDWACYCEYVDPQNPDCWEDPCQGLDDWECYCAVENPQDPDCWQGCDVNGDGVCDACDEDPDLCDPPCEDRNGDGVCDSYCDLNPQDPNCWQGCDNPSDPSCFCAYEPDHPDCWPVEPPCDPAADPDCPNELDDCDPAAGDDCRP